LNHRNLNRIVDPPPVTRRCRQPAHPEEEDVGVV
jgi:hypothetical protein